MLKVMLRKNKIFSCGAPGRTNRADKTSNMIKLVTIRKVLVIITKGPPPWKLKKVPWLVFIFGLYFHSKSSFKSIYEKTPMRFWRNVYQSAPVPQNLRCPETFLVTRLHSDIIILQNALS